MKRSTLIVFVVLGIILVIAIGLLSWVVSTRNGMVSLEEDYKTQWAQVENQLQRRFDLIPNLVETVKGYASHEKDVFVSVAEARAKVGGTQGAGIPEKIAANQQLTSALGRLLLVVERYPEVKANTNFQALQDELAGTENRLSAERRRYNESVKLYNKKIRMLPANIIAGLFGFTRAELYEAPVEAQANPQVDFSGDSD